MTFPNKIFYYLYFFFDIYKYIQNNYEFRNYRVYRIEI